MIYINFSLKINLLFKEISNSRNIFKKNNEKFYSLKYLYTVKYNRGLCLFLNKKIQLKFLDFFSIFLKNKNNLLLNKHKKDLLFKFPKLSYASTYILHKNILNLNFQKKINFDLNQLFFFLSPFSGISSSFFNIYKRIHYLTIGRINQLPLNFTYSGYYSPILIREEKKSFFLRTSAFMFIRRFSYIRNNSHMKFRQKNVLSHEVFPFKVPNLYFDILFFFTVKNRVNYFKNIDLFKNYNIFNANSSDFKLFKISWMKTAKTKFIGNKRITYLNLKSKNKHLLKWHRLSFNNIFQTKYRSHTITNVLKGVSYQNNKTNIKSYLFMDLTLKYFLIRIHFANNLDDSLFLITNGFVFINGVICLNPLETVKRWDRIQLLNNYNNYISYRFYASSILSKKIRLYFSYSKFKRSIGKIYKTQGTAKKAWTYKLMWNMYDIPNYVEVDFQIHTAIILYMPTNITSLSLFLFRYWNSRHLKMMNWNYEF